MPRMPRVPSFRDYQECQDCRVAKIVEIEIKRSLVQKSDLFGEMDGFFVKKLEFCSKSLQVAILL